MIIQCINCNKNFEVSSTLIPQVGRNIECGSCNHTWFYTHNTEIAPNNISETMKENKVPQTNEIKKNIISNDNEEDQNKIDIIINDSSEKTPEFADHGRIKKSTNFSIGKILSYFVVGIITFVALIIILNTFETQLNTKFPSLELIMYNLFETIEDISLFLKNLLV